MRERRPRKLYGKEENHQQQQWTTNKTRLSSFGKTKRCAIDTESLLIWKEASEIPTYFMHLTVAQTSYNKRDEVYSKTANCRQNVSQTKKNKTVTECKSCTTVVV